jgi:hypothetical protein
VIKEDDMAGQKLGGNLKGRWNRGGRMAKKGDVAG